jgi:hypothetical protein
MKQFILINMKKKLLLDQRLHIEKEIKSNKFNK